MGEKLIVTSTYGVVEMHYNGVTVPQTAEPRRRTQHTPYYVTHEFDGSAELTATLTHALSDVTGLNVTEAEATLNECVDPEALNRLFEPMSDDSPRVNSQLSFTAWGHQVTVYSNGQIAIAPPEQPAQAAQPPR